MWLKINKDIYSISLNNEDFEGETLNQESNIRPNKLFTADNNIVINKVVTINQKKAKGSN